MALLEWMSHSERVDRRKKIAAMVKAGATTADAAREFGVSVPTALQACHEHGVAVPVVQQDAGPKSLRAIAMAIAGESQTDIAQELGLTRQRVNQIIKKARDAGIFSAVKGAKK